VFFRCSRRQSIANDQGYVDIWLFKRLQKLSTRLVQTASQIGAKQILFTSDDRCRQYHRLPALCRYCGSKMFHLPDLVYGVPRHGMSELEFQMSGCRCCASHAALANSGLRKTPQVKPGVSHECNPLDSEKLFNSGALNRVSFSRLLLSKIPTFSSQVSNSGAGRRPRTRRRYRAS
jgi:hypothetical protein